MQRKKKQIETRATGTKTEFAKASILKQINYIREEPCILLVAYFVSYCVRQRQTTVLIHITAFVFGTESIDSRET